MNDQIICPNCRKPIPLTEALSHQIREKYQKVFRARLEEEKTKLESSLRFQLGKKIREEMDFQIKDKSEEIGELKKQNRNLQEQLLELNRLIRQLRTENEQRGIEMAKKLAAEQEKIRSEEKRRIDEEYKLKILEKDKKLTDAMKMVEDYKRKLEQGSQQLQGDVLEAEIKNKLQKEFTYDVIKDVPTGVKGADILQVVKNNFGKECGMIIWEMKRTKLWSDGWIIKLKEDQRRVKAEIAVIISQALPDGVMHFIQKDGVWVGNYESLIGLALVLRNTLIELSAVKSSLVGKQEKKEILWNYLTSTEFRQRLETIYDNYDLAKTYLDKEKEFFRRKWAREEKNIELLMENLLGIHGDLQAIIGRTLPEIKPDARLEPENKSRNDKLF